MPRASHLAGLSAIVLATAACSPGDAVAPARPGAASAMTVAAGNDQSALAGAPLASPVRFKLADNAGNGVPNAVVSFSIIVGEGSLAGSSTTAVTDDAGLVTAPAWTLGKLAMPQQLVATAGNISATATAAVRTQYHAEVRFVGPAIDPAYLPAFTRAISRLNAEVIGALTPVSFTNQDVANTCGVAGVAPLNESIGSLVIYVSVGPIGGGGGIVAESGPCYVRQSNHLTVVGTMLLDATLLPTIATNGQLHDVVFHELQHVLGFGTLWTTVTPMLIIHAGTPQTAFTGAAGIRGCQQAGVVPTDCLPAIPLENGGGPGSADEHWRWSIFGNELMTAVLPAPGTPKLLSTMTVGSLTDLGYQTNGNVADTYTIPSVVAASYMNLRVAMSPMRSDVRELVMKPRFTVTRDGVTSVIP